MNDERKKRGEGGRDRRGGEGEGSGGTIGTVERRTGTVAATTQHDRFSPVQNTRVERARPFLEPITNYC